ncbi:MAG: tetratricopeptide repeat protein [Acidobacteria bacterium]|nr:tetratricopeptide repeat protein [Acidobacteriota bacterium]MDA1235618.1 tetratricopeptide repeat protein [Acidobacteriota bacterium]
MKRLILLACVCLSAAAQEPDPARDLVKKAYLSIQNGDVPGAIAQFEDAVRLDPANPLAWKQLGYLQLKANDRPAALDAFAWTLKLTPQDHETALQRAFILRSQGRAEEAAQEFRRVAQIGAQPFAQQAAAALERLSNASDGAFAHLAKAYAALSEKDYDQAVDDFRQALAAAPARPQIEKELAYALLKTGATLEAREAFSRAVHLDPADERAAMELAFLQHETGQAAEALARFQRLAGSEDAQVRELAAATARNLESELDAAIARWVEAIVQDPANRSVHLELAELYEKRNQPAKAAAQYLEGWRLPGPDGDEVLLKLARASLAAGDSESTHGAWLLAAQSAETRIAETAKTLMPSRFPWASEFRAALALDPEHAGLRRELAYLLLEVGERDPAIAEFETLLAAHPNDYQAAAQLAFLYQEAGEAERAAALLEQAQESQDPEVAEPARLQLERIREERSAPLRELGEKSLEKSYLLDAQKQFAEAYSANPTDYAAALKLGVVHNLMQQDREAIEWFRIATASDDPRIAGQASRSYANLAPQYRFARTTVWMYPFYSRRFSTVFGYAQAKTEFRIGNSPIKPYISLRLAGDVRRRAGGSSPSLLSESALIAAVGANARLDHGVTLWGEAGESFSYLGSTPDGVPRAAPDYRGGANWFRARGSTLGGNEAGTFYEANVDVVYVSRFDDDVLAYSQFRPGYRLPNRGPLRAQIYWNWNVTADTSREYWGNYVETGPGFKLRVPTVTPPMDFSVDFVRGVNLSNQGNTRGPNYFDLRIGVWYSFTR